MAGHRIIFLRDVLLVEIVRRCTATLCDAPTRLGLTKEEALAYIGFKCERCETWNDDMLAERDVPEWWEELLVTGLDSVRPRSTLAPGEAGEVVRRMSDAWRQARGGEDDYRDNAGEREN